MSRPAPIRDATMQVRVSRYELEQVDKLAGRLGVPRSMVVRAALRAVVEEPVRVWAGPLLPPTTHESEAVSVARNPSSAKRSRPRDRRRKR